tara:strand:+ start:1929 stop:2243 length:315 start_codon:yes stop_codon:yes gene_type:complete
MKINIYNHLSIYHTNLRNIGLFITIALASYNFTYKSNYMKKVGNTIIPLVFIFISILLNIDLIYLINYNELHDYKNKKDIITLNIIPYLTMILLILLFLRIFFI